jgi:hypothetical protein
MNRAKSQGFSMVLLCAVAMLAACDSKPKETVWDMYDVRYPVPAGSNVPVSRASIYDRYTDNDTYYTPPSFGSCGGDNIGLGGCE